MFVKHACIDFGMSDESKKVCRKFVHVGKLRCLYHALCSKQ